MSRPARGKAGMVLAIAATVVVVAAVGAGFAVMGTPGQQRLALLDERRVEDLQEVAFAVARHARTHQGHLPADLAPLQHPGGSRIWLSDRITGEPFGYQIVDPTTFKLCATFDTATSRVRHAGGPYCCSSAWDHPKGHHCFTYPLKDLQVR